MQLDQSLRLMYESVWGLDVLALFQEQMITFSARRIFFDIDCLNEFIANVTIMRHDYFDCDLVTSDNRYRVRGPDRSDRVFRDVPPNHRLSHLRIVKSKFDNRYESISLGFSTKVSSVTDTEPVWLTWERR